MDISTMSLVELKALGYDTMQKIAVEQQNLQIIQQQIAKKQAEESSNGTDKKQN